MNGVSDKELTSLGNRYFFIGFTLAVVSAITFTPVMRELDRWYGYLLWFTLSLTAWYFLIWANKVFRVRNSRREANK
jgi:hypothetical protein